jgi:glycine/D-amino acid oxidase-like deaminating enzyme
LKKTPISKTYYDVAIVGQGIAGTLLAWFLYKYGKSVLIIDNNFKGAASKVAAGIVNPITGKNFVHSWRINEFLPVATQTYDELSDFLDIKAYNKVNIIRSLYSALDENNWHLRANDPLTNTYIKLPPDITEFSGLVQSQYGYGEIKGTYTVNLNDILEGFREKWIKKNAYLKEHFEYGQLVDSDESYQYKNHSFGLIIFCEGHQAKNNPFFPDIGMAPAKGEALILRIPDAPFKKMYKDGVFLVHQKEDLYWLGSGYEWDVIDENPTAIKYAQLLEEAKRILRLPFEVVDHIAAIRPTMHNRRPLLKVHSQKPKMYLFNGLGTKGASMGPFLAQLFAKNIVEGTYDELIAT